MLPPPLGFPFICFVARLKTIFHRFRFFLFFLIAPGVVGCRQAIDSVANWCPLDTAMRELLLLLCRRCAKWEADRSSCHPLTARFHVAVNTRGYFYMTLNLWKSAKGQNRQTNTNTCAMSYRVLASSSSEIII